MIAEGGSTTTPARGANSSGGRSPGAVTRLVFSARRYPHIRAHVRAALRRGWRRILVLNRPGADARRQRAPRDIPPREGFDRDEYPPAAARGHGPWLHRGTHPRGWQADVRYAPPQFGEPLARLRARIKARALLQRDRFRYASGSARWGAPAVRAAADCLVGSTLMRSRSPSNACVSSTGARSLPGESHSAPARSPRAARWT
jgi:hypothetical protein